MDPLADWKLPEKDRVGHHPRNSVFTHGKSGRVSFRMLIATFREEEGDTL